MTMSPILLSLSALLALSTAQSDVQAQIDFLAKQKASIAFAFKPNMSEWQYLLLPTPTVMVVLSSKVDVSLVEDAPVAGWKYTQHPSSLRASLVQMGQEGWGAFNKAHANMDHIALTMNMIPRHTQSALMMIKRMDVALLTRFLRIPLGAIEKAGNKCVELAVETHNAFGHIMNLTSELSLSLARSQGRQDGVMAQWAETLDLKELESEEMAEDAAAQQLRYQDLQKALEAQRAAVSTAMDNAQKPLSTRVCVRIWFVRICRNKERENTAAIKQAQEQERLLRMAEDKQRILFADMQAFDRELAQLEREMAQIRVSNVNRESFQKLLGDMLGLFGRIQHHWGLLIRYFTNIATRAKVMNTHLLGVFLDSADLAGSGIFDNDQAYRDMLIEYTLLDDALDISTVSHLLHTMAKTYLSVSKTHILEKLSGLASLLAAHTDADREKYLATLQTDAAQARTNIMNLITSTKDSYGAEILKKRQELMDEVQNGGGIPG